MSYLLKTFNSEVQSSSLNELVLPKISERWRVDQPRSVSLCVESGGCLCLWVVKASLQQFPRNLALRFIGEPHPSMWVQLEKIDKLGRKKGNWASLIT